MENALTKPVIGRNHYIAGAIVFFATLSWIGLLDVASESYIDGAIVQATVAFAGARALNAAVSVAQTIEISVVVTKLGIGEALDPINDLVEQYSTMMKYAIASLIVQKLLLAIISNVVFKLLLTVVAVVAIAAAFWRDGKYFLNTLKAFVFLGFLRFALVLVVILNGLVNQFFLNDQINDEIEQIETAAAATNEASIDPDTKMRLEGLLKTLADERDALVKDQQRLEERLARQVNKLTEAQENLDALEDGLGLAQRINVLNRDEKHTEAVEHRDLLKDQKLEIEDQIAEIESDLEKNADEQIAAKNTLEGKANSWLEAVSDKTGELTGGIKEKFTGQVTNLVDNLTNSVSNMLNLMAAFILKTLILPLLFLYMIVLLTKTIWNIDLKDHDPLKKQKPDREKELSASSSI